MTTLRHHIRWGSSVRVVAWMAAMLALASCSDDPTSVGDSEFEWIVSSPGDHGLDPTSYSSLTPKLADGSFGKISSFLVVKGGEIVYEQYFRGMSADERHAAYSVTKSFTSALVGIAIEEGHIAGVDMYVTDLLPKYGELFQEEHRSRLTLEHLLQMRAGFEWDEFEIPYASSQNVVRRMSRSADWPHFALSRPMNSMPGEKWAYNTGLTVVLGAILEQAVGKSVEEYAVSRLLRPIGITDFVWETARGVQTNTGFGMHVRPRDMARFGLLYLRGGRWDGAQIVPEAWIDQSFEVHSELSNGLGYGYQWWLMPVTDKTGIVRIPYADGYGDQLIVVIPHLDMVVVSTAEHFEGQRSQMRQILNDFVIPSVP